MCWTRNGQGMRPPLAPIPFMAPSPRASGWPRLAQLPWRRLCCGRSVTQGEQLVDPSDLVAGNSVEDVGQPSLRVDAVQLGTLDQGVGDGRRPAAALGADEEIGAMTRARRTTGPLSHRAVTSGEGADAARAPSTGGRIDVGFQRLRWSGRPQRTASWWQLPRQGETAKSGSGAWSGTRLKPWRSSRAG